MERNPNWTREELILALDLYISVGGRLIDDRDHRVIALSKLLGNLSGLSQGAGTFRNPNGVAMKLGNFSRLDPRHISSGKSGLARGGKLDQDVWNEFSGDHDRLSSEAARIAQPILAYELVEETSNGVQEPPAALFHGVFQRVLDQAFEEQAAGKEKIMFGTSAKAFAPLLKEGVKHVFFKAGSNEIVAYADFIIASEKDDPHARLTGYEEETWKYYYVFKNLKKLDTPIPIEKVERFGSNTKLSSASNGAFRINDLFDSESLEGNQGKISFRNEKDKNALLDLWKRRNISLVEKLRLVSSRNGQGEFRRRVAEVESTCRITGLSIQDKMAQGFLHACHIKPWADSTDQEKLDGNNGLLLSPHIHYLFDNGYLSFQDNGAPVISKELHSSVSEYWQIRKEIDHRSFSEAQLNYLKWHRENVFKGS